MKSLPVLPDNDSALKTKLSIGNYGYRLKCRFCGDLFSSCKSCFKSNFYCSIKCKFEGHRANRKKANKKYSESQNGKIAKKRAQIKWLEKKAHEKFQSTELNSAPSNKKKSTKKIDHSFRKPNESITPSSGSSGSAKSKPDLSDPEHKSLIIKGGSSPPKALTLCQFCNKEITHLIQKGVYL